MAERASSALISLAFLACWLPSDGLLGCSSGSGSGPGAETPDAETPDAGGPGPDLSPATDLAPAPDEGPGGDARPAADTMAGPDGAPDLGSGDAGPPPAPGPLVLMTFNLRTAWGQDGVNAWRNRRDLAASVVLAAAPDLLGTQEGIGLQLDDLQARLPGYAWAGEPRLDTVLEEHCAIFYRTARFDLLATDTFALSDTPGVQGSQFDPAQDDPRIVTWVRLADRVTGLELFVFNTHFDTSSVPEIRERSAALLVTRIQQTAGEAPVLVTGDFNSAPESATHAVLVGAQEYHGARGRLVDVWTELGLPADGGGHGFTGVATVRIDWLLHGPAWFTALQASVIHDHQGDLWPSDHFPVVATLSFPVRG